MTFSFFFSSAKHITSYTLTKLHTIKGLYHWLQLTQEVRQTDWLQGEEVRGRLVKRQTQVMRWKEWLELKPFQCAGRIWLFFLIGSGFGVVVMVGQQNLTKLTITLRKKCVLSFMIWSVNITIKYQNQISPTFLVITVPYSSPIKNKGICKNRPSLQPSTQQTNCTALLKTNMKKGNTQKQISSLKLTSLKNAGSSNRPVRTWIKMTRMKRIFILYFQLKVMVAKQQTRIQTQVRAERPRQWLTRVIGKAVSGRSRVLIFHGWIVKVSASMSNNSKQGKLPSLIKQSTPTNPPQPIITSTIYFKKLNSNLILFASSNQFCLADLISSVSLQNWGTGAVLFCPSCCEAVSSLLVYIRIQSNLFDREVFSGLNLVLAREDISMSRSFLPEAEEGVRLLFERLEWYPRVEQSRLMARYDSYFQRPSRRMFYMTFECDWLRLRPRQPAWDYSFLIVSSYSRSFLRADETWMRDFYIWRQMSQSMRRLLQQFAYEFHSFFLSLID